MTIPLFASRPKYLSGTRVLPTTDTGWATYQNGSRLFLPAATCLCADPQGTAATFWGTDTAHTTITPNQAVPVAVTGEQIAKCLKLVNDGTADAPVTANITVVASTSYRDSIWVYAPTLGGNLTITSEVGHTFTLAALTAPNAGWVRYSVQANTVAAEVTKSLKFTFAGGTASTVYVTGYNPIAAVVLTPYFDGTYTSCAWTGTANASTSTRTASHIQLTATSPITTLKAPFTVAFRFSPLWANNLTQPLGVYFLSWPLAANTVRGLQITTSGSSAALTVHDGAAAVTATVAKSYAAGSVNTFIARSTGVLTDVSVSGTAGTQQSIAGLTDGPVRAPVTGRTGSVDSYSGTASAYMGPVIISPEAKSDAWRTGMEANNGAVFNSLNGLWSRMAVGDWLFPLGVNSIGYQKRIGAAVPFDQVIFDGDSWVTPGPYPDFVMQNFPGLVWAVEATGGMNWSQVIAGMPAVDAHYSTSHPKNIIMVLCGSNDLRQSVPAATIIAQTESYCTAARAVGWKVVFFSAAPTSSAVKPGGYDAARATVNASYAANWANYADGYVDFTADPYIGVDGCSDNLTYWVGDGVHLITAGYAVLASYATPVLAGLL